VKYNTELVSNMKAVCETPDNDALYALLPDEEAHQRMITGNMLMVVSIVDDYLKSNTDFEYLRDDLTSEAFLALTRAVNTLPATTLTREGPTAYMSKSIRNAIHKAARHAPYQSSETDLSKRTMGTRFDTVAVVDEADQIKSACETPLDRELVRLRKDGYTFPEIAQLVGIPRRTVIDNFHAIRARYEEHVKELCA
jgi:RNA polymerase sigma factor (sigma-70 family)